MIRPSRAGLGSDMLGQWRGVRASYSPHQAGLQGLRRMGWDPRIQLTVGALGMAMHPPTLSSAGCGVQAPQAPSRLPSAHKSPLQYILVCMC